MRLLSAASLVAFAASLAAAGASEPALVVFPPPPFDAIIDRRRRIDRVYLAAVQQAVDGFSASAEERCSVLPPCWCGPNAYPFVTITCESCRCKSASWFIPPPPPSTTSTTVTATTTTTTHTATKTTTTTPPQPTIEYEPFSGCCRTAEGNKLEGLATFNLNAAVGDVPSAITSLESCTELCSANPDCSAVQYHRSDQTCALMSGYVGSTNVYPHCMCMVRFTEYPQDGSSNDGHLTSDDIDGRAESDEDAAAGGVGTPQPAPCPSSEICTCDVRDTKQREFYTDEGGCRKCGCFVPQTPTAKPTATVTVETTTHAPLLFDDPRVGGAEEETPAERTSNETSNKLAVDPVASSMTGVLADGPDAAIGAGASGGAQSIAVDRGGAGSNTVDSFRKYQNTSCFPTYAYSNTQVYTEFDLRGAEQFTGFPAKSASMCLEVCSALTSCGAAQFRHGPEMCFILLTLRNITVFGQGGNAGGHTCFRRNPPSTSGGENAAGAGADETDDGSATEGVPPQTTVFVGALPSSSTTTPNAAGNNDNSNLISAELEKWLETLQTLNDNSIYDYNTNIGEGFVATLVNATAVNTATSAAVGGFHLSNTALGLMLGCILGVVLFTVVVRYYRPGNHGSATLLGGGRKGSTGGSSVGLAGMSRSIQNADTLLAGNGISFRGDEFDLLGEGPTRRVNPLGAGNRSSSTGSRGHGRINGLQEKQSSEASTIDELADGLFSGAGATRHIVRENSRHIRALGSRRHKASMLEEKQSSGAVTSTSDGFDSGNHRVSNSATADSPFQRESSLCMTRQSSGAATSTSDGFGAGGGGRNTMKSMSMKGMSQKQLSTSSMHNTGFKRTSSRTMLQQQAEAIVGATGFDFTTANENKILNRLVRSATDSSAEAESILSGLDIFERSKSDGGASSSSSGVTETEILGMAETEDLYQRNNMFAPKHLQHHLSANSEASSQAV